MTEQFECICGDLRKTLPAASVAEALTRFRAYLSIYADRVQGATTITVRGPVRVRHATAEHVFDRATGEVRTSVDLRAKRRR